MVLLLFKGSLVCHCFLPYCLTPVEIHLLHQLACFLHVVRHIQPCCAQPTLWSAVLRSQEVPPDVLTEFEHELEEDLASVAVTLTAVTGVIIFWRGVWSLLDCESGAGL